MKENKNLENLKPIFDNIRLLINQSRNNIYNTVNVEMLKLYWDIGKIIMQIQQGDERASYGDKVLESLSIKLQKEFGKGFSTRNLRTMRKFLYYFSNLEDSVCQIKLVSLFRDN